MSDIYTYASLDFSYIVTSVRILLTWKGTADVQQKYVEVWVRMEIPKLAGIIQSGTLLVLPAPIDCDTCRVPLTHPLTILYGINTRLGYRRANMVVWMTCKFEFTI